MAKTSELTRHADMPHGDLPHCHEGEGTLDFTEVYSAGRSAMPTAVRFVHDDVVPPGASIGFHQHAADEEFYYVLAGTGRMRLDDEDFTVEAGDLAIVYPGGRHSLVNDGTEPLRILVVGAASR